MKILNTLYALAIIVLGVAAAIYAGRYGMSDPRMRIGAGFFPVVMGIGLAVMGVLVLVRSFSQYGDAPALSFSGVPRILLFTVVFCLYMWVLKPVGFIPASALLILFCMYQLGCRQWLTMIAYSIIMPGCVFALFYYCMYVSLPLGILEPVLPKY